MMNNVNCTKDEKNYNFVFIVANSITVEKVQELLLDIVGNNRYLC